VHFNYMDLKTNEHCKTISDDESCDFKIRYGVIELDDMLRDLQHWETLLTSSFMMRPYEVLEKGARFDEI